MVLAVFQSSFFFDGTSFLKHHLRRKVQGSVNFRPLPGE